MAKHAIIVVTLILYLNYIYGQDTLRFSGQLSAWMDVNKSENLPLWGGSRYIPQLNLGTKSKSGGLFDAEIALNLYGSAGTGSAGIPAATAIEVIIVVTITAA